jgi:hypothetical protein
MPKKVTNRTTPLAPIVSPPDQLLQLAQAAWLDCHQRTVGGALPEIKEELGEDTAFDRLVDQLTAHMDAGADHVIDAALNQAHKVGAEDVANELELACKLAATTYVVHQPKDGSPGRCAFLFAIPFCVYGQAPLPDQLAPVRLLAAIRDSINGFGLFLGNPEINLADRLITLEEMDTLSYGAVREITKEMADGGELLLPRTSVTTATGPTETLLPRAELRFIVFTVTQDELDPKEDEAAGIDDDDAREESWLEYLQGLLEPRFPLDPKCGFMTVASLDVFFEARYGGLVERANAELMAYIREFSDNIPHADHQYGAVLAPFGENGIANEVRIAFVDYTINELCGAFRYPIHRPENTDDCLGMCARITRGLGFNPVQTYAEVQSDAGLPPGTTGFLTYHPTASTLPDVPFPTSTRVH